MKKLKLLHIVTRLEKGGTLTNLLELAEAMAAGCDFVLALGEKDSEREIIDASAKRYGYRVIWLRELVREIHPWKDLGALSDLVSLLRTEKPDIVHTHTSKAGFLGRVAAKMLGHKNVVHTPHGHVFYGYFGGFKTKIFVLMETIAAAFTGKIIVISEDELKDNLSRGIGKREKYEVIPHGLDPSPYLVLVDVAAKKRDLGIPAGKKVLGFAGRFAAVKGPDIFIEAVSILSKKRGDFTAVMAGAGTAEEEAKLAKQARALMDAGLLRFIGFRQDLPEAVKVFDVLAMPSRNEAFGFVALQAALAGVPVVAAAVGGIPELVLDGETGLLVLPESPRALAEGIEKILDDSALSSGLSAKAKKRAMSAFTKEKMLSSINRIYLNMSAEKLGSKK